MGAWDNRDNCARGATSVKTTSKRKAAQKAAHEAAKAVRLVKEQAEAAATIISGSNMLPQQ